MAVENVFFGPPSIAKAVLDRIIYHITMINFIGKSDRQEEKGKVTIRKEVKDGTALKKQWD